MWPGYLIGYIIEIFSAVLYNEMIIFNFCGLNKYTKKYIIERSEEEQLKLMNCSMTNLTTGNDKDGENNGDTESEDSDNDVDNQNDIDKENSKEKIELKEN